MGILRKLFCRARSEPKPEPPTLTNPRVEIRLRLSERTAKRLQELADKRTKGNRAEYIRQALQISDAIHRRDEADESFYILNKGNLTGPYEMCPEAEPENPSEPPKSGSKKKFQLIRGGKDTF